MVARLPLPTPSSMGYFHSPELATQGARRCSPRRRWDLIFVHCSSVAQYVEHVTGTPKILDFGDMDSQKWLEYADYKPFPLSLGYRARGPKMVAAEKRLARAFRPVHGDHPGRMGDARTAIAPVPPTDWFPNGVDADYFAPADDALRCRHHQLHRPHGLLPEPGMHARLLRNEVWPRCAHAARR